VYQTIQNISAPSTSTGRARRVYQTLIKAVVRNRAREAGERGEREVALVFRKRAETGLSNTSHALPAHPLQPKTKRSDRMTDSAMHFTRLL